MRLRFECDNRWDDFEGDSATARRCPECDHMVHNLSAMTRDEARELFRTAESALCVTYSRRGSRVMFAEDLARLESQREGIRQLVRAAAVVAPLLIAGCLDSAKAEAEAPVETLVRFGEEPGAAQHHTHASGERHVNPEYVAYLRDKQLKEAAKKKQAKRSTVDKLGDELDRMMTELFGSEERKFDDAAVVAGGDMMF